MVDGITPNLDPTKPAARKFVKFKVAGGEDSVSAGKQTRPYNRPTFKAGTTYSEADRKAEEARKNAPSNGKSGASRLGKNAPQSIDGLSDPGAFASTKGQPKMASSSSGAAPRMAPTPPTQPETAAPLQNQNTLQPPISGSPMASQAAGAGGAGGPQNQPNTSPANTSSGTDGKKKGGDGAKKGGDENAPTDGASKMAAANKAARAKDNNKAKDTSKSPIADPTMSGQNKIIDTLFGKGELGKAIKKLWSHASVRWFVGLLGPNCCIGCAVMLVILVILLVFSAEFPTLSSILLPNIF